MACIPTPPVPVPPLPFPLTIAPPSTPDPGFDADLCCKVLAFTIPTPPIPLPPGTVNPATAAVIKAALASVQTYIDSIPPKCPRE